MDTYRFVILRALHRSDAWLTGRQIAHTTGLAYKATIDALCALHNHGKVARHGRKTAAMWGRLELLDAKHEGARTLTQIMNTFGRSAA